MSSTKTLKVHFRKSGSGLSLFKTYFRKPGNELSPFKTRFRKPGSQLSPFKTHFRKPGSQLSLFKSHFRKSGRRFQTFSPFRKCFLVDLQPHNGNRIGRKRVNHRPTQRERDAFRYRNNLMRIGKCIAGHRLAGHLKNFCFVAYTGSFNI